MSKIAILGVGNRFRGDDAAGWSVIDALEGKLSSAITLCKVRGDLTEVLDLFARYSVIFVVDASIAKAPEKPWVRIDLHRNPHFAQNNLTSTHGLTIREAVELANTLGEIPSILILYLIPGENFSISEGLSPSVERAIAQVVSALLNEEEIQACTKEV